MIVIGENNSGKQPTLDFCKGYAKGMGVPLEKTFIDWSEEYGGWSTLFAHINPYLGPNGEFAVPWEAVLDTDNLEYLYSSANDPYHNVMGAIFEAMSD